MSQAARYDFIVRQGSPFKLELQYKNGFGVPVDITGYIGKGTIKIEYSDKFPLTNMEVVIVDAVTGKVEIKIPPNALNHFDVQATSENNVCKAIYDVELIKTSGTTVIDVIPLLYGTVNIKVATTVGN
jgi:hypothetical protein